MRKKFIVGLLGLVVVVAGIAAFSAFTAQLINLEAHVEKEIELAAVKNCFSNGNSGADIVCEEDDGNFGTVIPQEVYDKLIELTLSRSFFDQDRWFDVTFDVLWECKQFDPPRDKNKDGFDDCREVHDPADPASDPSHLDQELDGRLRDSVNEILTTDNCIKAARSTKTPAKTPKQKDVEYIGSGVIDKFNKKCFYLIKLLAPPCSDSFNSATDPLGTATPVNCHFIKPTSDPQTWEHFADIGDEFKIQVTGHSPTIEVDEFPDSKLTMTVQGDFDGDTDLDNLPVEAVGPTVVNVNLGTLVDDDPNNNDQSDECPSPGAPDGPNGLEEVQTEIVSMELVGSSPIGPINVRLNPNMPSQGQIEENSNTAPERLDLPPFAPSGTACSFFDVFVEVEIAGIVVHNEEPIRVESEISHKPPAHDDPDYCDDKTIPLLDENGNSTGLSIVGEHCHDPVPPPIPGENG